MDLYPAVDLEGGRVVRAHGDMAEPLHALAELDPSLVRPAAPVTAGAASIVRED